MQFVFYPKINANLLLAQFAGAFVDCTVPTCQNRNGLKITIYPAPEVMPADHVLAWKRNDRFQHARSRLLKSETFHLTFRKEWFRERACSS